MLILISIDNLDFKRHQHGILYYEPLFILTLRVLLYYFENRYMACASKSLHARTDSRSRGIFNSPNSHLYEPENVAKERLCCLFNIPDDAPTPTHISGTYPCISMPVVMGAVRPSIGNHFNVFHVYIQMWRWYPMVLGLSEQLAQSVFANIFKYVVNRFMLKLRPLIN